ncbi:uncharacterized protein LOC110676397 [Aedes aegypti]|uniref:Uncharacterized protein n=1 Tax=Aedes aegypti TaxID=7159 RepID=A0A6I8U1C2_AEDAE|nr:uncharacterized protein LOC110676397 [Aedes aegypti]
MTRKRRAKAETNHKPINWQPPTYDADESDLEESSEMPSPLLSTHPNYPLEELELDLEETLHTIREQRTSGVMMPADVVKIKRIIYLFMRDMNIVTCDVNSRYLPPSATCEYRESESEPEEEIELIIPSSDSEDLEMSFSESESVSEDHLQVEMRTNRSPTSRYSSGYFSSKSLLQFAEYSRDLPSNAFKSSIPRTSNPESLRKQTRSFKIRKKANLKLRAEPTAKELCSEPTSILEPNPSRKNPRSGRTPGTQKVFSSNKKKKKHF